MTININGKEEFSKREKECLEFLRRPTLLADIKNELSFKIKGEEQNKLSLFLLCLSKDFDPQAIYLMGSSSAGKSFLINEVLEFMPNDCIEKFTRSSAHGLEYLFKDKDMNGKILVIQEALGGEQAEGSLRPMMSKDQKGLRIVTVDFNREYKILEIEGCPVYITSTTDVDIEHQMTTRVWFLSPDETEKQTKEILDHQAEEEASLVEIKSENKGLIKDAIKLLKPPKKIVIVYAKKIREFFPTDKLKYRRDFKKFMTLIKCSAYLHQYQRKYEDGILYASIVDLINALGVAGDILKQTLLGLSDISIRILNEIKKMEKETNKNLEKDKVDFKDLPDITHQSLAREMKLAEPTIKIFIKPLWTEGYVSRNETKKPYKYFTVEIKNTFKRLLKVSNSYSTFFSKMEFANWLSGHGYKVSKCSLCYEDINPFTNDVTITKEGENGEFKEK
jgi:hypothetical protein